MGVVERISEIIIETLHDLSASQQPLTIRSMSRALCAREDFERLLAEGSSGNGKQPKALCGACRTRADDRDSTEEMRKQESRTLWAAEELHRQYVEGQEFTRRALLTLANLLECEESENVGKALAELKSKLRGEIALDSLEECLQALKRAVLQEDFKAGGRSHNRNGFWKKLLGRDASAGQPREATELDGQQMQQLYVDILSSLPLQDSEVFSRRRDQLLQRICETRGVRQLFSLNEQVMAIIEEFSASIAEERSLLTAFIGDLGVNLSQIERQIAASFSMDAESQDSSRKFNSLLDGQIEELKRNARSSSTLVEFRGFVNSRLASLKDILDRKRREEERRWQAAMLEKQALEQNLRHVRQEIENARSRTTALERETLLDPLTGIYNRRAYEQRLKQEMQRFSRYGHRFSLLLFDVDHFKGINDQYGHAAGDKCLREMIQRFRPILRGSDFMARYGGEEFVVLLPGVDREGAYLVGEKLRRTLANIRFRWRGKNIPLTISVGVSQACPADKDEGVLFQRIDRALYQAKQLGRNRTVAV